MTSGRQIAAFEAIGSHWWVVVYDKLTPSHDAALARTLRQRADAFDAAYSRFLPHSYISQLNRDRVLIDPPVELVAIIEAAETMRERSHGAFNCGVGGALERLGYDAVYSFREQPDVPLPIPASPFVHMSAERLELAPDVTIDVGGLGKGWLIDAMSQELQTTGLTDYFVNGGGDIAAVGQTPKRFALESPFTAVEAIGEITVTTGALAASAPNRRAWTATNSGASHHHLINPRTGASHAGPAALHVSAPTATLADMASTALYVMPPREWGEFATAVGVEYLAIDAHGRAIMSPDYHGQLYQ